MRSEAASRATDEVLSLDAPVPSLLKVQRFIGRSAGVRAEVVSLPRPAGGLRRESDAPPVRPLTKAALMVERLADSAALERLTSEWQMLDAGLSPRTPFTSPLWNILWWKHYREDRALVHDELFAYALRDGHGRLVAVAPMMLTQRPARGPLRMRELQFFGADPNLTEIRGPVCRAEHQSAVVDTLREEFSRLHGAWDWLSWCGLRRGGAARVAPLGGTRGADFREVPDYYLPLPASWDEFRSRLSRNIKESLRKCYNSLKRDGHAFTFSVVERPEDVPAALNRFFELHAARAQLTTSIDHADVFSAPRARAFLAEYAQRLAERGEFRLFQVEIGGRVVAARVGFVLGRELYLYYSGYAVEWSRYSIMTTVLAETIKWAIEHGFSRVNLSTGKDVSKMRWGPVEVLFISAVQCAPARRSRFLFGLSDYLRRKNQPGSWLRRLLAIARRAN